MTGVTSTQEADRIAAALARISQWMISHSAPLLVANLAPGATPEQLTQAAQRFGAPLPPDLRALWSLHDGQRDDGNGFIEAFNLLSIQRAFAEQETVLTLLEFARESPDAWTKAGGTSEELRSNHWLPFAAQDSDSLVVSGVTGRVFACDHDDSPRLLAPSLAEWLENYASRVEADDYAVVEGFGDYYLELRDRKAERRAEERAERQAADARFRRETPLLDQFGKALADNDVDRCIDVLKDALDRKDDEAFQAAVTLLFASSAEPRFVAGALRPLLNVATLSADQWVDVAIGGALLGNNAIRDVAIARCASVSVDRLNRLAAAVTAAADLERRALDDVLQRLRAKALVDTSAHADAPTGNWFSRLFGKRPPKA